MGRSYPSRRRYSSMSARAVPLRVRAQARLARALHAPEAHVLAAAALAAGGVWGLLHLGGEVREGETVAFDRRLMLALRLPGRPHAPIGPPSVTDALRDV